MTFLLDITHLDDALFFLSLDRSASPSKPTERRGLLPAMIYQYLKGTMGGSGRAQVPKANARSFVSRHEEPRSFDRVCLNAPRLPAETTVRALHAFETPSTPGGSHFGTGMDQGRLDERSPSWAFLRTGTKDVSYASAHATCCEHNGRRHHHHHLLPTLIYSGNDDDCGIVARYPSSPERNIE